MSDEKKTEAHARLMSALPHFRYAASEARKEGKVMIGILSVKDNGAGKIVGSFDADAYFDDLALVLDAPPQTEENEMEAKAEELLSKLGIK